MTARCNRRLLSVPLVAVLAFALGNASVVAGIAISRQGVNRRDEPHATVEAEVQFDLMLIRAALEAFATRNATGYPESLDALAKPDSHGHCYLRGARLPLDPWKREYVYVRGSPPNVLTYGRDGVVGGTGDAADIDYAAIVDGR